MKKFPQTAPPASLPTTIVVADAIRKIENQINPDYFSVDNTRPTRFRIYQPIDLDNLVVINYRFNQSLRWHEMEKAKVWWNRVKQPLERLYAAHPLCALTYAKREIKGAWPPGEAAIATNVDYSIQYAIDVTNERFPAGEQTMIDQVGETNDRGYNIIKYARLMIGKRWPELEQSIINKRLPEEAYMYAQTFMPNKMWPKAEDIIAEDPHVAYGYAVYVIKGPWPKGEKAIYSDVVGRDAYKQEILDKFNTTWSGL